MKKKLLTLFLTACMLLVSASAADMMVISPNPFASDPWGLTMTMKDVTSTGGTIVFTQSGGAPTGELETGEPYWLEMQANGQWVPMEAFNNLAWIMPAYPIPTGGSREFSVNWSFICGALPAGTYRIAKNVMVPRSARTRPANALPAVCPVSTTVSRVSITLMAIGQTILCPNNFHDSNIING